ncbi:MAG: hypothetical protein FVQ79_11535 [Planctomycetes bacterium]|nr:hypothetical protein [Planctomycetota bacterium]
MKTWIAITVAVMMTFLVVGLSESEGKAFGQLGGYSRYSPSGDYTGGHKFKRDLIGGGQSGSNGRSPRARFVSYSESRSRYYRGRSRGYHNGSRQQSRVYVSGCR